MTKCDFPLVYGGFSGYTLAGMEPLRALWLYLEKLLKRQFHIGPRGALLVLRWLIFSSLLVFVRNASLPSSTNSSHVSTGLLIAYAISNLILSLTLAPGTLPNWLGSVIFLLDTVF